MGWQPDFFLVTSFNVWRQSSKPLSKFGSSWRKYHLSPALKIYFHTWSYLIESWVLHEPSLMATLSDCGLKWYEIEMLWVACLLWTHYPRKWREMMTYWMDILVFCCLLELEYHILVFWFASQRRCLQPFWSDPFKNLKVNICLD